LTVESNKKLGGLGAVLTLFGIVSTILTFVRYPSATNIGSFEALDFVVLGVGGATSMLTFVGFILFLVAMHGLSRDYNERRIFSYLLNAFIVMIVVGVILALTGFGFILISAMSMFSSSSSTGVGTSEFQSAMTPTLSIVMLAASLVMLIWIVANYKSFNLLADKTEVPQFRATAKLFLLGAMVTIAISACFVVLAIVGMIDYQTMLMVSIPGGLIQYGGWAYAAKGFYSIKPPPQTVATQAYMPAWTANSAVRYCTHCGAANQADSAYCTRCGQKMQ